MATHPEDDGYAALPALTARFVAAAELLCSAPGQPVVSWVRKGNWLFQAGQDVGAVYAILDGSVVRRKANLGGDPLALDLLSRGTFAGFRAYLSRERRHRMSAQCVTDCLVCRVELGNLDTLLEADRVLEHELLAAVAQDLGNAQERMLQVATLSVRDRLLVLLAQFSRDFTTMNDERTVVLAPPVSRTDMAALAGMTPETLSRCIRTLEGEKLAHFSRHHVVIPSLPAFRAALVDIGVENEEYRQILLAS